MRSLQSNHGFRRSANRVILDSRLIRELRSQGIIEPDGLSPEKIALIREMLFGKRSEGDNA
jgi:hypothetical protein